MLGYPGSSGGGHDGRDGEKPAYRKALLPASPHLGSLPLPRALRTPDPQHLSGTLHRDRDAGCLCRAHGPLCPLLVRGSAVIPPEGFVTAFGAGGKKGLSSPAEYYSIQILTF